MSVRTISSPPGRWSEDFEGALKEQYRRISSTPPPILHSLDEDHSERDLLLFFAEQVWNHDPDLERALAEYMRKPRYAVPVVESAPHAVSHLPPELQRFDAFLRARHPQHPAEALVDDVMSLTWQRRPIRKIFISYRRSDAEAVARQLHERYSERSFEVFLDDVSIPRGADFQVELRRWLDDADAVLLLVSPDVGGSRWVREEIQLALTRRIGLMGIVWPEARFTNHQTVGAASPAEPRQIQPTLAAEALVQQPHHPADAAICVVPDDLRLRLSVSQLEGSQDHPAQQMLSEACLAEVDHLLFVGRSHAIASRLRDLVAAARSDLAPRFEVAEGDADGDIQLTERFTRRPWLARVVPFRPDFSELWSWWGEQRRATPAPEGMVVVYPELDATDPRAAALREVCAVWGAKVSPQVRLQAARV